MRVELKDAKVELEVGDGKSTLYINGQTVPLPRKAGIALIFGEEVEKPPTQKPGIAKAERRYGCQTPASKRKLSASLKRFHANRRRKEAALLKKGTATKKQVNGKSHLNGASLHIN